MADGKDRAAVLADWEQDLIAPPGGWQQAEQNVIRLIAAAS